MANGAKKKAVLVTDGSCLGNPRPGGWACILRYGTAKREIFGYDPETTNNRMELMAAIQGLLAFKEPCEIEVTADAEYLLQGVTQWIVKWKRNGWWKKSRPIRNADLWIELDELAAIHDVKWQWTKGHADHEDNNRCDWLARNAAQTQMSSWPDRRPHSPMCHDFGRAWVPPRPQTSLFDLLEVDDDESID